MLCNVDVTVSQCAGLALAAEGPAAGGSSGSPTLPPAQQQAGKWRAVVKADGLELGRTAARAAANAAGDVVWNERVCGQKDLGLVEGLLWSAEAGAGLRTARGTRLTVELHRELKSTLMSTLSGTTRSQAVAEAVVELPPEALSSALLKPLSFPAVPFTLTDAGKARSGGAGGGDGDAAGHVELHVRASCEVDKGSPDAEAIAASLAEASADVCGGWPARSAEVLVLSAKGLKGGGGGGGGERVSAYCTLEAEGSGAGGGCVEQRTQACVGRGRMKDHDWFARYTVDLDASEEAMLTLKVAVFEQPGAAGGGKKKKRQKAAAEDEGEKAADVRLGGARLRLSGAALKKALTSKTKRMMPLEAPATGTAAAAATTAKEKEKQHPGYVFVLVRASTEDAEAAKAATDSDRSFDALADNPAVGGDGGGDDDDEEEEEGPAGDGYSDENETATGSRSGGDEESESTGVNGSFSMDRFSLCSGVGGGGGGGSSGGTSSRRRRGLSEALSEAASIPLSSLGISSRRLPRSQAGRRQPRTPVEEWDSLGRAWRMVSETEKVETHKWAAEAEKRRERRYAEERALVTGGGLFSGRLHAGPERQIGCHLGRTALFETQIDNLSGRRPPEAR